MKRIFLFVIVLACALSSFGQSKQIAFTGWNEYSINFTSNTGTIKVERINNYRNGGKSGTLYVQVWLFNSPYGGYVQNGWKIGDVQLGQLNGGWQFNQMSYPISWDIAVPAGSYHVSFLLVEYNPQPGGNYWVQDWVNFPQQVTKNRPETRDDAVVKLNEMFRKVNQQTITEGGVSTRLLAQNLSLNNARVEKIEASKAGKAVQEWNNIPWAYLYTIDGYETAGNSNLIMLSLKFDDFMSYSFTLDGKPEASSRRRDLRQINVYILRSDHYEADRLLKLIRDSYY